MARLGTLLGKDSDVLRDRNFQLLLLVNVLAPLGVPLVSPILSSLTGPFGVSEATVGLMISFYTAPPIVLIPLVGVLADRYGRKPLMLTGIVLYGIGGAGIAATTDFRVALGLRLLQGVGFAGLTPIIITAIGDSYRGTREATAQGLRFTTSGVYQAIFPLIGGALVVFAWQYPFLMYAMAFPIAVAVYLWFDEPAADGRETPLTAVHPGKQVRELLGLLSSPRVTSLVLARGIPMIVWIGFLTYNSIIVVRVIGGTPSQAGLLVTIDSITLALGASQAGRISDMFENWFVPLALGHLALGGGLSAMALSSTLLPAAIGVAFLGFGFGVTLSLYRSVVTGLAPTELRGGLVSIAESFGRVTASITPIFMGAAIGLLVPILGFEAAVRWTGVGTAALSVIVGIGLLLIARAFRPSPG